MRDFEERISDQDMGVDNPIPPSKTIKVCIILVAGIVVWYLLR